MTYIDQSLGQNEGLHYLARLPAIRYVVGWGMFVLMLSGASAAAIGGLGWLSAIPAVIGALLWVAIMLPVWTTEIGVTTQRLVYKRGLIWRTTKELQLRAVEEVNLEQGLLGRLFNYGRIELHGTGVDDIRLPTLADPIALQKAIQEMIGAAAQPSGGLAPQSTMSLDDLTGHPLVARAN